MSVFDKMTSDFSQPNCFMACCGLCGFKIFSSREKVVNATWEEHKKQTGHDVGFIRGKISKRKPAAGEKGEGA